ncbi:hypothetical protein BC628DRAFT_323173 [Trametes gibbosa]|nr:hypothetical protein BC628DRAFT_323173 [Trametes gibbosa]
MKMVVDSIPRPEVVKRVRPENRPTDSADSRNSPRPDAMEVNQPASQPTAQNGGPNVVKAPLPIPTVLADSARSSRPPTPNQPMAARLAAANKPIPSSPRASFNSLDQRPARESQQTMPPPSIPSQTVSAQELRESAKLTRNANDRSDDRGGQPPTEPRAQSAAPPAPSPRRRSSSPASRPGTRPASQESRASGDRRSTRESGSAEKSEGRRSERQDRESRRTDRERERDKDRERHRDGDSHRDHDRERDRDRDRDRHRRDEKDRDRDPHRKDRERGGATATPSTPAADDRGLPSRPDTSRHRGGQHDDTLGKRRRGAEDERSSRKDSHHEDRSRRTNDKEHDRTRDSDRRRKDRDVDSDSKGLSIDTKVGDKRVPDGPASAKSLPPSTPSAPRAMTSGDSARKSDVPSRDRDRDWKRDQPPLGAPSGPPNGSSQDSGPGGSLRSRISGPADRDARPPPQTPSAPRDDERDGGRKRTLSERERDVVPDTPVARRTGSPRRCFPSTRKLLTRLGPRARMLQTRSA